MHDFSIIYQLAKKRDSRALQNAVFAGTPIDSLDPKTGLTASQFLAAEGDSQSVTFLRQHKANVDKIAVGYAIARFHDLAVETIRIHNANPSHVAHIYAKQNNYLALSALTELVETPLDKHFIISGYAAGGHHSLVRQLLNEHASDGEMAINLASSAVIGFAKNRMSSEIDWIKERYDIELATEAIGYVLCGYHQGALEFCHNFPEAAGVIAGHYARLQKHDLVDWYSDHYDLDAMQIIQNYVLAEHHQQIERYIKKYHDGMIGRFADAYAHRYIQASKEQMLFIFSQFKDNAFRRQLAYCLSTQPFAPLEFIDRAERIHDLVIHENMDYAQAYYATMGRRDAETLDFCHRLNSRYSYTQGLCRQSIFLRILFSHIAANSGVPIEILSHIASFIVPFNAKQIWDAYQKTSYPWTELSSAQKRLSLMRIK